MLPPYSKCLRNLSVALWASKSSSDATRYSSKRVFEWWRGCKGIAAYQRELCMLVARQNELCGRIVGMYSGDPGAGGWLCNDVIYPL